MKTNISKTLLNREITKKVSSFQKAFRKKFKLHRHPLELIDEEYHPVESQLTMVHNTNPELNAAFFQAQSDTVKNKNLHIAVALSQVGTELNIDQERLLAFASDIFSLKLILAYLRKIKDEIVEPKENPAITRSSQFTLARHILYHSLLMRRHIDPFTVPDKTAIAKLIWQLTGNYAEDTKIENSNLYKQVKKLFFDPKTANKQDLLFIQEIFKNVGMLTIASEIEQILKEKDNKK